MQKFVKQPNKVATAVNCLACGADVDRVEYIFQGGEEESQESLFYRCPSCGFLFARPVFIPELTSRHMDGVDNAEMFNSRLFKFLYIHLFIRREIRKIRRALAVTVPRLLDVGCGTGWTSKVYADDGFLVTGLEPSRVRAGLARERYGLEIIEDYIENLEIGMPVDVVVLRHVIEHFESPGIILDKVRGFLNDNGLVFLVVPNINCLGRYMFETEWAWILPWHCNFFTPESVRAFFENKGFEVVDLYQTPSPLYFPGSFMRKLKSPLVDWLLRRNKILSMLLFAPLAVLGNFLGMGDNINVLARIKR